MDMRGRALLAEVSVILLYDAEVEHVGWAHVGQGGGWRGRHIQVQAASSGQGQDSIWNCGRFDVAWILVLVGRWIEGRFREYTLVEAGFDRELGIALATD